MLESGRVSAKETDAAWATGYCGVVDPRMSCQQMLHISLFFDGTNNNDDEENVRWRDSLTQHHTNVARLYNVARHEPNKGIYKYYIPGVGTPFPKIGEYIYSEDGKAFAAGFNQRCVWAYTRVLNAVYDAIRRDPNWMLIRDDDARVLSHAGANGDMQGFEPHVHRLGIAHKQAVNESRWPNTVKRIWINVIGFSRGAAAARAFVHKLVNEWAPGGRLGDQTGKYALPYQVNFMGLFDTVASVGLPDSFRAALNLERFDGHAHFASNGALAIPDSVRYCIHAFSIHEQQFNPAAGSAFAEKRGDARDRI